MELQRLVNLDGFKYFNIEHYRNCGRDWDDHSIAFINIAAPYLTNPYYLIDFLGKHKHLVLKLDYTIEYVDRYFDEQYRQLNCAFMNGTIAPEIIRRLPYVLLDTLLDAESGVMLYNIFSHIPITERNDDHIPYNIDELVKIFQDTCRDLLDERRLLQWLMYIYMNTPQIDVLKLVFQGLLTDFITGYSNNYLISQPSSDDESLSSGPVFVKCKRNNNIT